LWRYLTELSRRRKRRKGQTRVGRACCNT
jgi:hypothetical protein